MIAEDPDNWSIGSDGGFRYKNLLVVPETDNIKKHILEEAHRSRLTCIMEGRRCTRI